MHERQFKASLLPIMVIIFCILMIGVVAGAFALNRQRQAVTVLQSPGRLSHDPGSDQRRRTRRYHPGAGWHL